MSEEYRKQIWDRMARECPRFTRAHDSFDDPWAVEALVLGDSIGFKPFVGARAMDVGANVGLWTAFCATAGAHVTSYEADPITFAVLSEMLKRTNLTNVCAINAAVWTYAGECLFRGDERGTGGRLRNGAVQVEGKNAGQTSLSPITVPCLTLEQAVGDKEWDAVKIDVEGAELEILMNVPIATLERIRYMQVELHHAWMNDEEYAGLIDRLSAVFSISGAVAGDKDPWEGRYHWVHLRNKKTDA